MWTFSHSSRSSRSAACSWTSSVVDMPRNLRQHHRTGAHRVIQASSTFTPVLDVVTDIGLKCWVELHRRTALRARGAAQSATNELQSGDPLPQSVLLRYPFDLSQTHVRQHGLEIVLDAYHGASAPNLSS